PFLQTRLELPTFEAVQLLVGEVVNMCNNTRLWTLKGHTPHELSQEKRKHLKPLPSVPFTKAQAKGEIFDIKTRKKVGRNDSCPCGSGKKYKHCCDKA
ncbi:MAG TPA: SEC-C metal-binding domain-containing protein, partial [Candidatus Deferrimicrobium sp.]|nr:SEC-C metal-binding domain-containing protein [Candidatus Deferrimicrobium sp.]